MAKNICPCPRPRPCPCPCPDMGRFDQLNFRGFTIQDLIVP
jgi:ribosomal protein RSM22 (predicted rRNA methylase)